MSLREDIMFHVCKMSAEDYGFAVRLTDTKNWGFVEEDFKFMTELEPEGCFTLFSGSEKVGIVTSISFGLIGWLGTLIVEEKHRRMGGASQLVRHVIDYLTGKGVETVGLYSYLDAMRFYGKFGFKYDATFTVFEGKPHKMQVKSSIKEAKAEDLQRIIAYDSLCLNTSRKKLIKAIFHKTKSLCYFYAENGLVRGYVMAKVYDGLAEIGPLICNRERGEVAIDLIKTVFNQINGYHATLCIPKNESVLKDFLVNCGFKESFDVARMFLKQANLKDCIYVAESLERG
ncbi:MAG: GNAT family N-acetyltransferase [Candidatus Bathyarchaeia archaeon]